MSFFQSGYAQSFQFSMSFHKGACQIRPMGPLRKPYDCESHKSIHFAGIDLNLRQLIRCFIFKMIK